MFTKEEARILDLFSRCNSYKDREYDCEECPYSAEIDPSGACEESLTQEVKDILFRHLRDNKNDNILMTAEEFIIKHQELCNENPNSCLKCRMTTKCLIDKDSLKGINAKEYVEILSSNNDFCKKCGFIFDSNKESGDYKFCPKCGEKRFFYDLNKSN